MAVTKKFSSVAPPTNIDVYGEGSFLVGFWGEAIKYSKNGKLWYEHPKQYGWEKGNYAELDDVSLNDNDKTIDLGRDPIFISKFFIQINNTATVGNRTIAIRISGSNTFSFAYASNHIANEITTINFGPAENQSDLTDGFHNVLSYPKFWNDNIPFWNTLRILDSADIDSNDDWYIYLKGVYALPKYHWIKFENCENFQVEKITESLTDGIFTDSNLPNSLKVLKV